MSFVYANFCGASMHQIFMHVQGEGHELGFDSNSVALTDCDCAMTVLLLVTLHFTVE